MPSVLTTTSVPTAFCAVPTGTPCAQAGDGASHHAAHASPAASPQDPIRLMARSVPVIDDADRLAPDRHGGQHRAATGVDHLQVVRDLVDHEEARAFTVARDPVGALADVDLLEDPEVLGIGAHHHHPVQAGDGDIGVRTL